MKKKQIIIIYGPTASGKTDLAIKIAKKINGSVINADSKQVYQDIEIISAQPTTEEKQNIEHLLYGFVPLNVNYNVSMWLQDVVKVIELVIKQGKVPILVGGTGLYIYSLINGLSNIPDIDIEVRANTRKLMKEIGLVEFHKRLNALDPMMAQKISGNDAIRMARAYEIVFQTGKSLAEWQQEKDQSLIHDYDIKGYFLNVDREILYNKCNKRFINMVNNGALDEVKNLMKLNLDPLLPAMKGHGIPELIKYLNNELLLEEAIDIAQKNTRHYIKRQFTWYRHQLEDFKAMNADGIYTSNTIFIK